MAEFCSSEEKMSKHNQQESADGSHRFSLHTWLDRFIEKWESENGALKSDRRPQVSVLLASQIKELAQDAPEIHGKKAKKLREDIHDVATAIIVLAGNDETKIAHGMRASGIAFAYGVAAYFAQYHEP